ncbi:hypothetical protein [Acinetobacter guillouiae]|uniref:hypothetical protein n=1 Tax=Acinetobacter guillouiae TaxID=106649 RepID=UPI001AEB8445|nr:hypothetical protein [Acinetobacter guillouiae]MBP2544712.1 uncharacterized protein YacL [Acinetobacter guillouiae]
MKKNYRIEMIDIVIAALVMLSTIIIVGVVEKYSLQIWDNYATMQPPTSTLTWLRWGLGDVSEAQFYKSELASLGLFVGAGIAYYFSKMRSKWQGFQLSYGTGLFPWILLSSSLSLILSNIIWGWTLIESNSWQPTFVTFVSLPAATVLMYGRGFKIAIIGAVAGALFVTPSSLIIVNYVCVPLNLPSIIGNVLGMAIGSLIAFILFKKFNLSCLVKQTKKQEPIEEEKEIEEKEIEPKATNPFWVVRRALADFSESQFIANEWAGLGLIIGALLAIYLNPLSISYGSGLIGNILISQMLAALTAVILWKSKWEKYGWYPTYIPISSVAPVSVLVFGGSLSSIILGAFIGACVAPPLAAFISKKLPKYQHPYIGNVVSMAITSLLALGTIHLVS